MSSAFKTVSYAIAIIEHLVCCAITTILMLMTCILIGEIFHTDMDTNCDPCKSPTEYENPYKIIWAPLYAVIFGVMIHPLNLLEVILPEKYALFNPMLKIWYRIAFTVQVILIVGAGLIADLIYDPKIAAKIPNYYFVLFLTYRLVTLVTVAYNICQRGGGQPQSEDDSMQQQERPPVLVKQPTFNEPPPEYESPPSYESLNFVDNN